jgi:hypothetical protein
MLHLVYLKSIIGSGDKRAVQRIFDDQHVPQVRRILFNILVVELANLNITIKNTCNAAFRDAFAYPCDEN